MSYEISYRRQAFVIRKEQALYYDDLFFLLEETGSNNCWEIGNRRRARSWVCLAADSEWECMTEVTQCAASCCGGALHLYGSRRTSPEQYIRAWRKAIANCAPFEDAQRLGYNMRLFVHISMSTDASERKYALERIMAQKVVPMVKCTDTYTGKEFMEWCFDAAAPEQLKIWLDTREGGRGFNSVEVTGPER
jgi:hypothetical protein